MTGTLHFERDPRDARIGRLTIANPGRHNAIGEAMWRQLLDLAGQLDAMQPWLRAVIVQGEGGVFAAGADIREFPAIRFATDTLRGYHEGLVAPALAALRACDVPLLACIEGACVGGGLELACCCDLRIAGPDARFGIPIARLGFPMAPDEMAVVRAVASRETVAECLLEARLMDVEAALRRGLVQRVVPDAPAEAWASAQRMAALPPGVARANKRSLRQLETGVVTEAERARHFGYAASAAHREGVSAFLAGREPDFSTDDLA